MKRLRTSRNSKAAAFVLLLIISSAAVWLSFITISSWDDLWYGGDYYRSNTAYEECSGQRSQLHEIVRLKQLSIWNGWLSYSDQGRLNQLEAALAPEVTNFRYQIHDEGGVLLDGNLSPGTPLSKAVGYTQMDTFSVVSDNALANGDYTYWDEANDLQFQMVATVDGPVPCDPRDTPNNYNQYGWLSDGTRWVEYNSEHDTRIKTVNLVMEYGIADPITVEDNFSTGFNDYNSMKVILPTLAACALLTLGITLTLLIFLCWSVGRREGTETLVLGWLDRIPYDLYLLLLCTFLLAVLDSGGAITYGFNQSPRAAAVVAIGVFTLLSMLLLLSFILTTVLRLKTHTLLRNTLIWRLCAGLARGIRGVALNWPVTRRPALLFSFYLLGTLLTTLTIVLIPVYQGAVLFLLCRWVRQWRAIREGTQRIVGGQPDARIDTGGRMFRDLREHAEQLNDLGSSIGNAVDERLRSERFKTELITNVSHDLKTPLTSIINYVDLLKKLEIGSPQALEYIDVLDRKSQRLKKLTEDLVEASKASTGNLTVNKERLGVVQLIQQALAEYEEKFSQHRLEAVTALHPSELYVEADGRHLWRIIDNLLGNCYKYALEGTRVYLDVTRWDGTVTLAIKNISKQQLNIPADQLMERFVRGEESRSTEGSGLGLSIARSLTELQGGMFRLAIDGDLFKAIVSFPEAPLAVQPQVTLPPHGGTPDEAA